MDAVFFGKIIWYLEWSGIRVSHVGKDQWLVIGLATLEIMPAEGVKEFAISYMIG